MAPNSILGPLFETDADPSKVQQALQALEASAATHFGNIEAQFDELQEKSGDALKSLENHLMVTADGLERLEHQPHEGLQGLRPTEAGPGAMNQAELEKLSASASNLTQNMRVELEAMQKSTPAHQAATQAVKDHQTAITALAEHIPLLSKRLHAELLPSLAELDAGAGSISRRFDDQLTPSFQQSSEAAKTFGDTVSRALARATEASNGAVVAESARLTATLGFRRVAAGIEAVWETAKSIAAFAEWDIRGGILHGMAAAEYGIIAGTSGRHAHGAGGGGRPALGSGGEPLRGRGEAVPRPGGGGGGGTTVVFNVQGHLITGPETAEWMAGQLTDFVQNRDGTLMSSHTKDSTLTRDSLNG